jgi:two-component system CheB/CheR fusion protein
MLKPDGEQFLLVTLEDITVHEEAERLLKADKERLTSEVESTAKELGRSQEELRALAGSLLTTQEDERRRMARELHDDVSQRLAALDIDSDEIQRSISSSPDLAGSKLQELRGRIAVLVDDVRKMSHRLHPSSIEELGLAPALRALTQDFDRGENMIATFSSKSVPASIPIQVATGIYRIAQEALRNVAKHAGRTHVRVTLKGTKGGVRLEVSDAGLGFDPSEGRSGLGLVSMEERARIIGATLEVKSALGQGTTVTVDVPLQPSAKA